jgi:glycosyltransferase involved in cell wall biosynthesis
MLTTGLVDEGARVHAHLIVDIGVDPPLAGPLREAGVEVHVTEVPPRRYGLERAATRAILAGAGADVVHCHGYRADVVDAPAARGAGYPTVSTVHGFTGGSWRNAVYEWLQLRALRRCDRVVAVSEPLVAVLERRGVASERIRLLPNAYATTSAPLTSAEARAELGLGADGSVVGWIGRLSAEKAPDVFAAASLRSSAEAEWVLIGDGPEREAVEALGAPKLRILGLVPSAASRITAFDVLVLSSRTEGTPIVALEAMAAGVPVVATAVGGVPDLLADGAGVLVPSDDPDTLASAIDSVLSDPDEADRLARAARRRLEARHALGPWVASHLEMYAELASARS